MPPFTVTIILLLTHLTPTFGRSIFPRDTAPDPTTLTVTGFGPSGSDGLEPLDQYPGSFNFTIQDQQSTVPNATCSWPAPHLVGNKRTSPVPLNVNQPCGPRTYQYLVREYDGPDYIQMVVSHTENSCGSWKQIE
ncbi:MAG: hypothetical protein OHK93_007820 [Ramalina farinacea]|uniref:Uncharacterized protein n=1 Tax=Ramalina farinacea TaxID=258253 RepID=A0AA43QL84_9LECA|nr:hypothetical protein [Ramalina farinacea]